MRQSDDVIGKFAVAVPKRFVAQRKVYQVGGRGQKIITRFLAPHASSLNATSSVESTGRAGCSPGVPAYGVSDEFDRKPFFLRTVDKLASPDGTLDGSDR